MLEQLLIFTRGGLVLWTCQELGNALKGSPIDALIRSCLLEERAGDSAFQYDVSGASYTLKWTFHNELGLVFVAVYQRMLHLLYVDELLSLVKKKFSAIYSEDRTSYSPDFDDTFRQLLKEAEARAEEMKRNKQTANFGVVKKGAAGKKLSDQSQVKGKKSSGAKVSSVGDEDDADSNGTYRVGKGSGQVNANGKGLSNGKANGVANGTANGHPSESSTSSDDDIGNRKASEVAFDVNKLQKLRLKGSSKKGVSEPPKPSKEEESKKKPKKNRVWGDAPPPSKLDYTNGSDQQLEDNAAVKIDHGTSMMDAEENSSSSDEESDEELVEKASTGKKGWFSTLVQSVAGKSSLEKGDLEPALKVLKDGLMTKNVAEEIAEKLCESVAASLVGKKLGSFTRITSTVRAAMEEALLRILTPKRSVDILRDVQAAKEQGRPFVIVFVGVNGVGKSTNLAKVAYWLQQHGVSVMMAACDTFRSGAVEQLRTHARRLQIPIFERGYEKDPAVVAKEAIREACRTKQDVVLVDTAGRMQDNEPLMRALSKLINVNEPDLVLFVGEALVGNDGVDQLMKFNQSLADMATTTLPRLIDGILLTKFDTIDDKVGAALSMVYISGAPVVFVGCGQTYTDLKRLNVKSIIKTLLN
ncbi:signal recognition particle receptor subunit alpha [Marchantia polymorpha subsp. ruderalis]|uniref:SRP54-type proteins GTP-binding domain-containing protein n=2 Tax=Marchantia polymorpha TaxID=3197 RepID=A0A176WI44_MARPO|nr:hypothetical protein AXG93_2374s1200 [Marchantia polymorpha subsp. ruderalis]PTQ36579.1 hypothetical protein MARPO_0062s0007 [Marchantia polymorpha]BBN16302.1 hypothetical protein Mp_7g05180 [Marchantia polymorpha subsp. ruderalis]|eukprot:PTQ36579.1 hypothetical protein MARPO_0062s0007 [Marchantia polymorpha]